jgi:CYTH domain-containing protein
MYQEIERKFLINSEVFLKEDFKKKYIKQGYLNSDKNRTVRIRIADDTAFITIKGKTNKAGTTRFEWEKPIAVKEAEALLLLCEPTIIEKDRYFINYKEHLFEVDVFYGENEGLILAEIELNSEDEIFEKPFWLGEEVTGNIKYYNSYLSKQPFKNWA